MKDLLALDRKITKHIMRNIWCKRTSDDGRAVACESVQATKDRRRKVHYREDCRGALGRKERSKVVGIKFKK